eukprot:TRINITY_DN2984_c0_g1_i2.p1 TRINITY_DN2984_c0_g1~~TRINITY_DN2984_c0_g1_i2.p1  ORF type:complete len:759 (+),score=47.76 TRINITY_DN2984_c0_g1_i2:89-2365(+)
MMNLCKGYLCMTSKFINALFTYFTYNCRFRYRTYKAFSSIILMQSASAYLLSYGGIKCRSRFTFCFIRNLPAFSNFFNIQPEPKQKTEINFYSTMSNNRRRTKRDIEYKRGSRFKRSVQAVQPPKPLGPPRKIDVPEGVNSKQFEKEYLADQKQKRFTKSKNASSLKSQQQEDDLREEQIAENKGVEAAIQNKQPHELGRVIERENKSARDKRRKRHNSPWRVENDHRAINFTAFEDLESAMQSDWKRKKSGSRTVSQSPSMHGTPERLESNTPTSFATIGINEDTGDEGDDQEEDSYNTSAGRQKRYRKKIAIASTKELAELDDQSVENISTIGDDDEDERLAYKSMEEEMEKDDMETELKKNFPSFEKQYFSEDSQKLKRRKPSDHSKQTRKSSLEERLVDEDKIIKPIENMQDVYKEVNSYLSSELEMSNRKIQKVENMTHIYAFSAETLKTKVEILCKYLKASKAEIGFMLFRFPKLFGYSANTLEERLLFWKDINAWMQHIKAEPGVLSYSLESIQKKEQQFIEMGISTPRVLLRAKPDLVTYKVETVHGKIQRLADSLNMQLEDMVEWVTDMPVILRYQVASSAASLKWLLGHGFTTSEAAHQVRCFPNILSGKFKRFKKNWRFLIRIGLSQTQAKQFTMRANRINNIRIYNKQLLVRYIQRELGMDPLKVSLNFPQIYTYSLDRNIAPRVYFLRERYFKIHNMKLESIFAPEDEVFAKRVARYPYLEYKDMLERQWGERLWPQLMQNLLGD